MSSYQHLGFPLQPGVAPPDDDELETWPEENVETFEDDEPQQEKSKAKPKSASRKPSKKD